MIAGQGEGPTAALGVDADAVRQWIVSLGVEHDGDLTFARVGLGQSNLTVEVRDGVGHRWILRRPPLGALLDSAHDVVREARILRALGPTTVPTPDVLGLCLDESVSPAPMVLMRHIDGLVIDRIQLAESVGESVRRGVSLSMVDTLVAIHAVDLEATQLSSLASHKPYADRQLRRWTHQWELAKTRELPELERLTATLRASTPKQEDTVLVHGDFHLRNVICSPQSGTVHAALDWELATLGDPLADLGSMLAYWPEAGDPPTSLFAASALPGFATRAELVEAYLTSTGRDESAVHYWHALGLWKIAIISEGVLRRTRDEPRNTAEVGPPDPAVVGQLVERALAVLASAPL